METTRFCVGIDVSKDTLSVNASARPGLGAVSVKGSMAKCPNTPAGFKELYSWAAKKCAGAAPLFVMEATGAYHEQLAWHLKKAGADICVLRPDKAKKYMESTQQRGKTDPADAGGLARMGLERPLPRWSPPSENLYALRGLTRHMEDLNTIKTSLTNRLEAVSRGMYPLKEVEKGIRKAVAEMDKLIKSAKTSILETCSGDPALKEMSERMAGVPGVGLLTAAVVLAETDGFALFESVRQLTAYAGYDPVPRQSGKMEGKSHISKKGNAHLRRAMHMPSLHAAQKEPALKALYDRVYAKTGIKMKGYVAVQRKLLCLLYSLCKNKTDYKPGYRKEANTEANTGVGAGMNIGVNTEGNIEGNTGANTEGNKEDRVETGAAGLPVVGLKAPKKAAPAKQGLRKMEPGSDDHGRLFKELQI